MKTNGSKGWMIAFIFLLMSAGLTLSGMLYADAIKRVDANTEDIREMDKNQVQILTELKNMNDKLDRLLGE